jgi:diacylglycerol kinase family enzyme
MEGMPAAASIAVILNAAPARPRTAGMEAEIVDQFRAAGRDDVEIIALQDGQDPAGAARNASTRASIVVAAGGDGTVSSVATGIFRSEAALGILPLGTLNHFARDLRIPFDLSQAVAIVCAGRIGQVDVGQVNDHLFVNNSSIGIYPSIVDAREMLRRQGHRKWPAMVIATVGVLRRYRGVRVTIDAGGRRRTWRSPFVFVGNNEYTIDGIGLGARASLDAGMLFVYLTPRVRTRHLPILLLKALAGHARRSGEFEIVSASELWIETSRRRYMPVAFDGELRQMQTPLHYRALAKALRVVVPQV